MQRRADGPPSTRARRTGRIRSTYLARAPRLIAAIATLLGLATLAEAVFPHERARVHAVMPVVPVPASVTATVVVAVSGLLLLRIATALRRRKRRAWQAAVVLTVLMTIAHAVGDERRPVEATITLVLLIMLLIAHGQFTAKPDPRSRWVCRRGLRPIRCYVDPLRPRASVLFRPGDRQSAVSSTPTGGSRCAGRCPRSVQLAGERFPDVFHGTLLGFGLATVLVVTYLALRPAEPLARLTAEDEDRLRRLLDKHGERDSLGYFALRRDKSVIWSPTGKAAITYRVVQGVALASGDPIGDPEAWPGAMAAYRQLAQEHAWTIAVIGCGEQGATVFKRECGLSALELGDEAVVDTAGFTLGGRPMRGVRQACTRVKRAGYTVKVRRARDIDPTELAALAAAAETWRGDAVERGFSMALSRLGDPADPDCVVTTAYRAGALRGVLHFVPWGDDGLSLDLMRRDRSADNGLNELMIATLFEAGPALGVQRVSLNFAVFRDVLERGNGSAPGR